MLRTQDRISLPPRPAGIRGLKYVSMSGPSGYFATAKRCLLGLEGNGVPVTWTPMVWDESVAGKFRPFTGRRFGDPDLDHLCNRSLKYDTVILHLPPDLFPDWIEREQGRRLVGYTIWETERLPAHWPDAINRLDLLLTPTTWNRDIFRKSGVTIPQGVLPYIARSGPSSPGNFLASDTKGKFIFYTIESWTARKDLPRTIGAYLEAFTADDPTLLIIKTIDPFHNCLEMAGNYFKKYRDPFQTGRYLLKAARALPNPNRPAALVARLLKSRPRPARIKLLPRIGSEQDLDRLHAAGHCYVSLAHAEGWGLGPFDAAARGRPVITTGYGGTLHYLPPEHAFLVNYQMVAVGKKIPGAQFHPEDQWAEADQSQAAEFMRYVLENRTEAQARGRRLRQHVLANFHQDLIIRKLLSLLQEKPDSD